MRLRGLRARFDGPLLSPGHDEYDAARIIWNGSSDRRPALIARCASVDDVAAAIGANLGPRRRLTLLR